MDLILGPKMKLKLFISVPVLFYLLVAIIYTEERPVYITYTLVDKTGMNFERLEYSTGLLQSTNPNLTTNVLTKISDKTYSFKQKVILRQKPLLFIKSFKNEPKTLMLMMLGGSSFKELKATLAYKALQNKTYKYELLKSDIVHESKTGS